VYTAQRGAHKHDQSTANTIPRSATQSHSSHSETQRSDAHATTPIRNRNTAAQHPTHCARDCARDKSTPKTRIVYRAYDAATMLHILAGSTRTSRTCRLAPRSPLPSHHKHARADTRDETSPTQHNGTAASWRVPPNTARHTAPTTPDTAHRKSHPVTHAASAPHSPQSYQAAQRRRDAAGELVQAQVQHPAGHTISHRVTPWHPTPPPTPASRPQRIAAQRIA
jgi:hypothetical protein